MYLKKLNLLSSIFFVGFCNALDFDKWAGKIMSASTNDIVNVNITINATSPKKSPTSPSNKIRDEKAIIVVIIAETIAGITSIVPSIAASSGVLPCS